ncbi:hypothetical protein RHGRI_033792 [Rhododendron griersonianum]|uniref:Prolyl endopeptidase n=1 Tax=Rhododendron griersonianum TaxID=479676 RepID=A0AAV6I1Z0_9ERIC|nr:hypothetical protein RHGRI_033792 [Rhododendron griersonianum]
MTTMTCSSSSNKDPPIAKKEKYEMEMFGDLRVDNYYWLRDDSRSNAQMLSYLQDENAYTEFVMSGTKRLEDQIYAEIRGRIKEEDISAPVRRGPYYYYERTLEGKEYVQHCRRLVSNNEAPPSVFDVMPTGPDAPPEHVILDENLKASGHAYYSIGAFKVSPNNKLVAYAEDTKGDEIYSAYVIDAETKTPLEKPLAGVTSNLEWAGDGAWLYITMDATLRPDKVWLHYLGTEKSNDLCLYHEKDDMFSIELEASESKEFLFVASGSKVTRFVFFFDISKPEKGLMPLTPRLDGIDTSVSHRGNHFFILRRSDECFNSELLACPLDNISATTVLLPHRERYEKLVQLFWAAALYISPPLLYSSCGLNPLDVVGFSSPLFLLYSLCGFKALSDSRVSPLSCLFLSVNLLNGDFDSFYRDNDHMIVKIQDVQLFTDHLVVYEREMGLPRITVFDLPPVGEPLERFQGGRHVDFIDPVYSVDPSESQFSSSILRFSYRSLRTPWSVYDYDMNTGISVLKKIETVLGGFDALNYVTERQWATAPDGTQIPISVVYQKNLVKLDGSDPLLLYGYGSYEHCLDPSFKGSRLSLLDRGFIYAIAHIRGGGEMGRQWYENGKLSKKNNTFTDFIACAEYLIEKKYCTKEKLCIEGRSAGGLLIGAVLNMRPDLFKAAIAGVPFVDVLTTMLDPTIPLTTSEWEVKPQKYPAILVTAGLHDPRVMYSEPAKFVAKLRAMKTDDNLLLFKCEQGAGHFSKSGRFEKLQEDAFVFAFIMKTLDMVPTLSSGEK